MSKHPGLEALLAQFRHNHEVHIALLMINYHIRLIDIETSIRLDRFGKPDRIQFVHLPTQAGLQMRMPSSLRFAAHEQSGTALLQLWQDNIDYFIERLAEYYEREKAKKAATDAPLP